MPNSKRPRNTTDGSTQPPVPDVRRACDPASLEELVACCEGQIPAHEEIAARARAIWEERGRPAGEDLDIWVAAETDLLRRRT